MDLWNNTFRIDLVFSESPFQNKKRTDTIIFKGSLKSAIRHFFKDYGNKNCHVVANFNTSNGEWLKEICI